MVPSPTEMPVIVLPRTLARRAAGGGRASGLCAARAVERAARRKQAIRGGRGKAPAPPARLPGGRAARAHAQDGN